MELQYFTKSNPKKVTISELEIRDFMSYFSDAMRRGDKAGLLGCLAPDAEVIDVMPPLKFLNREDYLKAWQKWSGDTLQFPIEYNMGKLQTWVSGNVAFCHALVNITAVVKRDSKLVDHWVRCTFGLRRTNGKWQITHFHNSLNKVAQYMSAG